MIYPIEEEKNRQRLIMELMPWWKQNGWSERTLQAKSIKQLLGIRHSKNKAGSKVTTASRSGQASMYFQ